MTELLGMTLAEMTAAIVSCGLEKYRAKQLISWIYQRFITDFQLMTDLSKQQREMLAARFTVTGVRQLRMLVSDDRLTHKFLLELTDGMTVETVVMEHSYGCSICVSTQVGCAMGCVFCASTLKGFRRNLSTGEILSQVLFVGRELAAAGKKIHSIVIMGSGEPLLNYDNVVKFIRLIHADYSLGMSCRNITLSTCGIVPNIIALAKEGLPITLAISLHAPETGLRSRLMPINERYGLQAVLQAADSYAAATGRRVTYEYILIDEVNSSVADARNLAALLHGRLANVNIIPVNPVPERGLLRPTAAAIDKFAEVLTAAHVTATVRREMGTDIKAACGQLRNSYETNAMYRCFD